MDSDLTLLRIAPLEAFIWFHCWVEQFFDLIVIGSVLVLKLFDVLKILD